MKKRPHAGLVKTKLISTILKNNKTAMELFDVEELFFEDLYKMKNDDLRNVDTELRVQIGIKRSFSY